MDKPTYKLKRLRDDVRELTRRTNRDPYVNDNFHMQVEFLRWDKRAQSVLVKVRNAKLAATDWNSSSTEYDWVSTNDWGFKRIWEMANRLACAARDPDMFPF